MNLTCLHYTTCCIDFLFPMKLVDWTKGHATVHCMCFRHENVVRIAALKKEIRNRGMLVSGQNDTM